MTKIEEDILIQYSILNCDNFLDYTKNNLYNFKLEFIIYEDSSLICGAIGPWYNTFLHYVFIYNDKFSEEFIIRLYSLIFKHKASKLYKNLILKNNNISNFVKDKIKLLDLLS